MPGCKESQILSCLYTVTFVAQIQFRPDISTADPDLRKFEVCKSQEFHDNHECITLKRYYSVRIKRDAKTLK